jgi:hypothetical protein
MCYKYVDYSFKYKNDNESLVDLFFKELDKKQN